MSNRIGGQSPSGVSPYGESRPPSPRTQRLVWDITDDRFYPCPLKLAESTQHHTGMSWKDYFGSWARTIGTPFVAVWHAICDCFRGGKSADCADGAKKLENAKRAAAQVVRDPEELAAFNRMLTEAAQRPVGVPSRKGGQY